MIVVDQDDNEIGYKDFADLRPADIHRVAALLLTDKKTGDLLLTQRKWDKIHDPEKWMLAASGMVEEGESYAENIVHETEEEIGLTGLDFHAGPKEFIDGGSHRFFVQWYTAETDKQDVTIVIQEEEVEAFAWVPRAVLLKEIAENPGKFVPSLGQSLRALGITSA